MMPLWRVRDTYVSGDGLVEIPDGAIPIGFTENSKPGWPVKIIYLEPED